MVLTARLSTCWTTGYARSVGLLQVDRAIYMPSTALLRLFAPPASVSEAVASGAVGSHIEESVSIIENDVLDSPFPPV